ncbi:MAG: ATP-binding protein [Bryobacteraceae bacterium]
MFLKAFNVNPSEAYMFRTDTLRFTYVNQRTLDNLGYTLEAMQALTPIDITPEATEDSFRKLANPLLIGEQAELNFKVVHQRKNGSTYSRDVQLQVIGQGEERTFLAFMHDATASKQQALRQTTQHAITRLLLESNSLEEAAPYIMGMICHTLDWNVGVLWKLDEQQQELRCAEVWDDKRRCAQFIERSRQSNFTIGIGLPGRVWKSRRVEWVVDVVRDDNFPRGPAAVEAGLHAAFAFPIGIGERLYGVMEFFATALREPDHKLLDMFEGVAGQISQFLNRKLAEHQLRNAKSQAEQAARERGEILATVDAFFICVNGEGVVTTWTPRAETIFGISLDEALGRPFTELPIQWSWKEVAVAMEKASDTINSIRVEKIRLVRQNGKEIFLKLTVSPICDDRGVTYVFMGEDISDRLALEHDLVQAQKLESIGHLAAGIAHEINTPTQFVGDNIRFLADSFSDLAAVLAWHRVLLLSAKAGTCTPDLIEACEAEARRVDLDYLTEEVPKAIAQSSEGVTRIATIVRAMKEFAHPGNDEKACVDLNKAIESTVTVARNEWKYIADLTTDLAPDLPLVPCLLGQFNQVILNMIVNATHAIADVVKSTGAKGTISIATRSVDGWAEVRITDSGTGIPEEIRRKIFDPFFTTKEVGKGTGQGLAIAHSVIVDKHHGTISLESEVGRGSTFIVRVPLDLQATTAVAEMAA